MSAADGPVVEVLGQDPERALSDDERVLIAHVSTDCNRGLPHLRTALRDPTWAPLAERSDTLLSQLNPNSSTKNVGQILRIDVVAQASPPFPAWRR